MMKISFAFAASLALAPVFAASAQSQPPQQPPRAWLQCRARHTIKAGETHTMTYQVTNTANEPITGMATYNVAPAETGRFFNKLECFCFTEQTLQPGQSVEMPVTFFVDPKMMDDRDTRHLQNITLSYVFYPVKETAAVATQTPAIP